MNSPRLLSLLALALLGAGAACVGDAGVRCADGTLCPDDTTCAVVAGVTYCASADQLSQCAGATDGAACDLAGQPGVCRDQVCVRSGCGDGVRGGAERCDGADLGGASTCRDLGFYGDGALTCADDCTYDQAACAGLGRCGDGQRDPEEQCDGAPPTDVDCRVGGFYEQAGLACNAACRYDFAGCTGRCGDGVASGPEECDGAVPAALDTCGEHGFHDAADAVTCGVDCRYDLSACDQFCGDGVVSGDEQCDGAELGVLDSSGDGAVDCRDLGYYQGGLSCLPNCQRNLAACAGRCGDGQKQPSERCDGTDFGTATCTSNGFYTGTLGCGADCQTLSTAACSGRCGDGAINGPERCDGAAIPPGFSCGLFGYYRGSLACAPGCGALVTTACAGYCGDGVVDAGTGERCDGLAQSGSATCEGAGVAGIGPVGCDSLCRPTLERCALPSWAEVPGLTEIGAPTDLWTAGNRDVWMAIAAGATTRIRRNVDHAWTTLPDVSGRVSALWAAPDGAVVLAATDDRRLLRLTRAPVSPPTLSWQPLTAPTAPGEGITDLAGRAADQVYAVTTAGRVLRGDPLGPSAGWVVLRSNGPNLRTAALADDGAIVVGGDGTLQWDTGAGWTSLALPSGTVINHVAARSRLDAWAVGNDLTGHLVRLRWDGTTWIDAPLVQAGPWGPGNGVVAGASDDVWIGGGAGPSMFSFTGLLLRSQDADLALVPGSWPWLTHLAGSDLGDLWAAAYDPFGQRSTAWHRGGEGWRRRPLAPFNNTVDLRDVSASADATWIISTTTAVRHDNRRAQADPARVTTLAPPAGFGAPLTAVWSGGVDQAMVFAGARAWRYQAGAWSLTVLPTAVVDAWGIGAEVFAIGGDRLHHWDGASWTTEVVGVGLHSISGLSATDVWIAGDRLHRRTGPGAYQLIPPSPFPASSPLVYAASPQFVMMVGSNAGATVAMAWLGTSWTFLPPFDAPQGYLAITGTSPRDIWLLGERNTFAWAAHWDGAAVTPISLPDLTWPLRGAAAAGRRDLWAVGDRGEIVHLDHRLPGLAGGACEEAPPIACTVAPFYAGWPGQIVDRPTHWVLDAPITGTLSLFADQPTDPVEVRVLGRGPDGACDPAAPLLAGADGGVVPIVAGQRYYLEVRSRGTTAPIGFQLMTACSK